ncbi:hypothetical protein OHS33_15100 [Streptomyces sp. NBC_00536]|uniref:hypothetical protein n=1 Tax=Streptomyces sp. NBC_00536 TaxID=2975769 RepID=UPI002E809245|nr:hypothetical protein [Streptomyces sp. NBC_00536]WUC79538.1 hypothetical protein OHS33_15100 [Streptomyces sp. NBC_00536]
MERIRPWGLVLLTALVIAVIAAGAPKVADWTAGRAHAAPECRSVAFMSMTGAAPDCR